MNLNVENEIIKNYTVEFIEKNLYNYEMLYFSHNDKDRIASELNLGCMIEDAPKFIRTVSWVCPVIYPVTSYNQNVSVEVMGRTFPANSFTAMLNIIESLRPETLLSDCFI